MNNIWPERECDKEHFECRDGPSCIPASWFCDGDVDCRYNHFLSNDKITLFSEANVGFKMGQFLN